MKLESIKTCQKIFYYSLKLGGDRKLKMILRVMVVIKILQCSLGSQLNIFEEIFARYVAESKRTARFLPFFQYTPFVQEDEAFDFIIVGSGAAGSVLANRLSENSNWKILLLEAGKVPSFLTDIPFLAPAFQQTDYNWGYLAEKQDNMSLGLEEGKMAWPRGKALGGTSIINHNIYTRGNRVDYDRWASLGNPGWSYEDVLPYFKKSEDSHLDASDQGYHQTGGNLGVQDVPYRSPGVPVFIEAMKQYGYKYVDYNGKDQLGVSYMQATLKRGRRASALRSFLDPARFRGNLKILPEARATKVLIHPQTKRAYGVEYVRLKKRRIAFASKEVLVSAGALNSPQLLMLSGVGPKWHLDELEIPLVRDLPVGQKLYDHLSFTGLAVEVNQDIVMHPEVALGLDVLPKFLLNGTGPLTHLGSMEAIAYIRTDASTDPVLNYPDVELLYAGGHFHSDRNLIYRRNARVTQHIYDVTFKPLENRFAVSIAPMLLHPKSYGYIRLKSSNPLHWPKFYGNYFTDPENSDVKTFIASIREIQSIIKQPALRKYGARVWSVPIPGCERFKFDSDPYWECALRHVAITLHHQVATCKMGPANDREAIVDERLKVRGVDGLRVVDTSVIPLPLSAHTNAPAYMIGEKGADLIKGDWKHNERQTQKRN